MEFRIGRYWFTVMDGVMTVTVNGPLIDQFRIGPEEDARRAAQAWVDEWGLD